MLSKGNGFQKVIGQLFSYKTKRGRDTKRQNGGRGAGNSCICKTLKSYHTLLLGSGSTSSLLAVVHTLITGLKYLMTSLQRQAESMRISAATQLV